MNISNNVAVKVNDQGVITAAVVQLTGPLNGYAIGNFSVSPDTFLAVNLGNGGALTVGVSNPIYLSSGLFGVYISSATYNNGAFTQVTGTRAVLGIPLSSAQTPSSYLLNKFNNDSSLSNIAGNLQAAAQLGQQLLGCTVTQ